jgi:hypothetical protein
MINTKINNVPGVVVPADANKLRWGNPQGNIHLRKMAEYVYRDFRKYEYDRWI